MPLTTTAIWPTLTDGKKAKASEVEAKFTWLEGDQLPMVGGQLTTGVYNIGSSAYRWQTGYFNEVYADNLVTTATIASEDLRATAKCWGWTVNASGTSSSIYNISSISYLADGQYRINWDVPFATNTYAVIVNGVNNSAVIATASNFTLASADVFLFNDAGVAVSSRFDVMAIGEQ
jgi:hypothetical protein